jgi:hypothetical protein
MALTAQQQKHRSYRITSTRAPAIVGCDPDKSLHGAAREILGIEDEVVATGPMERGTFMEDGIARWFTHRTGMKLRKATFRVHKKHDCFGDSADYIAVDGNNKGIGIVECKNYLSGKRWDFGEPGTDEVDQRTFIQSVWHMMHHDLPRCWVPLAAYDLDVYVVQRDRELEDAVEHQCLDFYEKYILPSAKRLEQGASPLELELPPIDGKEATSEWISKRLQQKRGDLIAGDGVALDLAREHKRLAAELDRLTEEKERIGNQLKLQIGENYGFDFEELGKVLWGHVKGKAKTDWSAIAAEAGVSQELIDKHTRIGEGYRALRNNLKESK